MLKKGSLTWKRIRLTLTFIGFLTVILGWYLDRAPFFPRLLKLIAPDYVSVKQAIDILDSGEKVVLPPEHPGAKILLKWWKPKPNEQDIKSLSGIGRSTGIFNIITGKHRYELRLLTQENKMMLANYIWDDTEAKKLMEAELNKGIIKWSGCMIWGGLILSSVLVIWEYNTKTT
jgi:hypothetical protein